MVVTWPTPHASKGWLKTLAEENIDCAAPAHAHGLWLPPWQLCVRKSSLCPSQSRRGRRRTAMVETLPTFQAARGWLKTLAEENILCHRQTRTAYGCLEAAHGLWLRRTAYGSCVCARIP